MHRAHSNVSVEYGGNGKVRNNTSEVNTLQATSSRFSLFHLFVLQCHNNFFDDLRNVLLMVHLIASMVWSPDTDIRFRLFGGDTDVFPGRDVFFLCGQ